jgi:four helix bundle protein
MAGSFRNLRIWEQAIEVTVVIYRATAAFPRHELYGLVSQLRRASVSIACISQKAKARHLTASSFCFSIMQEALFWKLKDNS